MSYKLKRYRRKSSYLSDEALNPLHKKAAKEALPAKEMLLRVEASDFVAGAVFRRRQGIWRCVKAAPIIEWMKRVKHMELIKGWLLKNKCQYSFYSTMNFSGYEHINQRVRTGLKITRCKSQPGL